MMICASCFITSAQIEVKHQPNKPSTKSTSPKFFPLSELKEGMTGTARTVFRGNKPESFNVEILGVVPGAIGPKQDMIVGKISGGQADRTHVFAGMSGSPVYIDGKLVGAIAYSFPFSKEAICGITPIRQMISIFEKNQIVSPGRKKSPEISFAELASQNWQPNFPNNAVIAKGALPNIGKMSALNALVGQTFQPIATPITFSGFSQATLNEFGPQLMQMGLLPVSAVGGTSSISPLKKANEETLRGGTSVVMQLTRGDYSLSAAGTVTLRDGNKIYAFGHPFLSLGSSNMPMSESSVVTVVPSVNNSFKLAVPHAMVGSMTQDRATGVFGKLGTAPKMIPVKLNLRTSRNQQKTFIFEIAKDSSLTPLLINIAIYNSIIANERTMGNLTITLDGQVKVAGHKSINLEQRFMGAQATRLIAASVAAPINVLLGTDFDGTDIDAIELNLTATSGAKTATLEQIGLNKTEVRAGEKVDILAYVREKTGKLFIQKIPLKIPADTPNGTVIVTVGDGNSLQFTSTSSKFTPKNLTQLINMINSLKNSDRLYVQTHRITKGAVIGVSELPNLPPSVLATLNNARTVGSFKPTLQTILTETELPPADFLITGRKTIKLQVIK